MAKTQRQLNVCQWLVPALTAGLEALNALHGEQLAARRAGVRHPRQARAADQRTHLTHT